MRKLKVPTKEQRKITELENEDLNLYEAVAVVYEEHLTAQLDNYEAIAEVYETIMAMLGGVE